MQSGLYPVSLDPGYGAGDMDPPLSDYMRDIDAKYQKKCEISQNEVTDMVLHYCSSCWQKRQNDTPVCLPCGASFKPPCQRTKTVQP